MLMRWEHDKVKSTSTKLKGQQMLSEAGTFMESLTNIYQLFMETQRYLNTEGNDEYFRNT